MASIEVNDEDTCSSEDAELLFASKYQDLSNIQVAAKGEYCLQLSNDVSWENISVSNSDGEIVLLKLDTMQNFVSFKPHTKAVTCTRFCPNGSQLLCSSSLDGFVKLWDIRSNKCEIEFMDKNKETGLAKPFCSFDISINERILCAGSELIGEDAFLVFWDFRGKNLLGGYWESHTDDITQVAFNPEQADTLATSAGDGLINVFDISQASEDDALIYCMNLSVNVDKLSWVLHNGKARNLAVTTDLYSLQYWNIENAAPTYNFSREDISKSMRRKKPNECYLVCVSFPNNISDPILLAGSGMESEKDGCLRTLKLDLQSGKLVPHGAFVGRQPQTVIRTALYNEDSDSFVTAGENGMVSVWEPSGEIPILNKFKLPSAVKSKTQKVVRKKPY